MSIPWEELARQFGSQERALRNFRLRVRRGFERIRVFYPGLRFDVSREALRLFPARSHVQHRPVKERAAVGRDELDERRTRSWGREALAGKIRGDAPGPPP